MRRLVWVLALLLMFVPALLVAQEEDEGLKFEMPNVHAGYFYDFETSTSSMGVISTVMSYQERFTIDTGWLTDGTWVISGAYKLIDLERMGIEYAWADYLDVGVGMWMGYDFDDEESAYGLNLSVITIEFGGE